MSTQSYNSPAKPRAREASQQRVGRAKRGQDAKGESSAEPGRLRADIDHVIRFHKGNYGTL